MATNGFAEILFPIEISYGSSGGPQFKTTIFTADSGYEQRNIDWVNTRAVYDVSQNIKDQDDMETLTNFFMVVRGRAYGFRFLDYNDYQITNQQIGTGDGTTTVFQLIKTYSFTDGTSGETDSYTRTITKPAFGSVAGMTVGGVVKTSPTDYSVDYTTGLVTFVAAPAADAAVIVGAAQFHVPVRFDTDHLDVTQEFWETSSWPNIKLVEVRNWGQALT